MTATKKETTTLPCEEQLAQLQAELTAAKEEAQQALAQLAKARTQASAGWIVTVPNKSFKGVTLGIQFRAGQAVIEDTEEGRQTAQMMIDEYGYEVKFSEDWRRDIAPAKDQPERKNIAEMLSIPERR